MNSYANVSENAPLLSETRANQIHDVPVFIGCWQKAVFGIASCGGEELAKSSMKCGISLTKRHSGPPALREKCEHVADYVSVCVPEGRGENSSAF